MIGCLSQRLRRQALRDNPTLKDLLAKGRAQERSEAQAEAVEKGVSPVNSIKHEQSQRDARNKKNHEKYQQSKSRYFGNAGNQQTPPGNRQFPTRNRQIPPGNQQIPDQQCRNCGGIFPHNGDCRACGHFAKIRKRNKNAVLTTPRSKIFTYGSNMELPLLGMTTAEIRFQSTTVNATFYVTNGQNGNLLSCNTAESLGILKITINTVLDTPNIPPEQNFPDLLDGIGKIKDKTIKLHIDPEIEPKEQSHRRNPFHIRQDVERGLKRLEDLDIIETVEGPTPWVSPIVVVPKKSGEIRLCVDMLEANKAVKREKHLMPTLDELIADLNGATVFSTLDLTSGYHQLELDPESRHVTTFSTHVGLRRYKRLIAGINAASEIFQNSIAELLTGLPGCKNISNDIIVYGRDVREHDENLNRVLTRLREYNARLNPTKCTFRNSKKVQVKSLLGMAQYVSRFIPNYAAITAPLRALTHQNSVWKCDKEEETAFRKLQDELTSDRVMSYFDPTKPTEVLVDASPMGLGAILMQDGKVISYGGRALSDVESRYFQTEREMLAIVWATEHYHLYL
ncbi:Hypothetical predicted protein [Paramuricea clavata]|uniref:Uncharacterized protein n=1 Tax=Paramuricea clavata TaxID=317549 RepID=A0A7D9DYZ2_PARCT|nr:Hypothetical predicted protein [Paramuricea clavata]